MAPKLNEDVLRLIFDYFETPLQWIQLSEGKLLISAVFIKTAFIIRYKNL